MSGGLVVFLALLGGAVFLLSQALFVPAFGADARMRKLLKRKLRDIGAFEAKSEVASLLRQKYLRDLSPLERRLETLLTWRVSGGSSSNRAGRSWPIGSWGWLS